MNAEVWDRLQEALAELGNHPEPLPYEQEPELAAKEEAATHPRRHRRLAASVLVLVLVGGAGVGGWYVVQDRTPQASLSTLLQAGLAAQQQGEALTARGIYLEALGRDSDNTTALFNLGVLAQSTGDTDEALQRYRAASALDPELADALFNEATILATTDRTAAVDRYRRVLAIQPQNAAAHLNLGLVLAELGSVRDAKQELTAALALDASLRSRVPAVYAGLLPRG